MLKTYSVIASFVDMRMDRYVSEMCVVSRSKATELISTGGVSVDGLITRKPSYRVRLDQEIEVHLENPEGNLIQAENIPLDVLFEDEDIIVINKPKGMLTHPTPREDTGTLVNALLYHTRNLAMKYGIERAGIVHRLDRDTSGILIVAKNNIAHAWIAEQFQKRKVTKHYIAIVYGKIEPVTSDIIVPLLTDHSLRKIIPSQNGKFAATRITKVNGNDQYTVLKVRIYTGRTHQIRVHMQYIGHPVVGDLLYGLDTPSIPSYKTAVFIPPQESYLSSEAQAFSDLPSSAYTDSSQIEPQKSLVDPPVTADYKKTKPPSEMDYSQPIPLLLHAYSIQFTGMRGNIYRFTSPPPSCFEDFLRSNGISSIFP